VLVSDDAQEIVAGIDACVEALSEAGRRDVHWLLTARDDDWQSAVRREGRDVEASWDGLVDLWPAPEDRTAALAVTAEDAAKVVAAWADVGALAPEALIEASEETGLLGASLRFRHGADALASLVSVKIRPLQPGPRRAFLATAVAAAAGIDGVDLAAIARMVDVDPAGLASALGRAGLTSSSGGLLRARHPSFVVAALPLADAQLEDLFRDLLRAGAVAVGEFGAGEVSARLQQLGVEAERADRVAAAGAGPAADASDRR
jgi:hypothetical protein